MVIALSITTVLVVVLLLFARPLVSIFTQDQRVIDVGAQYFSVIAPFYFAFTIMFVTNGVIRGAGEALIPMFSTLFAMWLIRLPCAILFSHFLGVVGSLVGHAHGVAFGIGIFADLLSIGTVDQKSGNP